MIHIKGIPASQGLCRGQFVKIDEGNINHGRVIQDIDTEKELLNSALILAIDEITALSHTTGKDEKDIFTFQSVLLQDGGLNLEFLRFIEQGEGAASAVEKAGDAYCQQMLDIGDDYLSLRAADIKDACRRVVDILDGQSKRRLTLTKPSIVVADDLLPSDIVAAERELLLGFVTSEGSPQSHVSILARTMGIPAVVMAGSGFPDIAHGKFGAVNGDEGEVFVEPDSATMARFSHIIGLQRRHYTNSQLLQNTPCTTKDGKTFLMLANCSAPEQISNALNAGCDGIGLLRSEYMLATHLQPSEEIQYEFYRQCTLAAKNKPIIIRTFDVNVGNKEPNPAMGQRGIRHSLSQPHVFRNQLRAILRASVFGDVRVVFPMVTTLDDVTLAMEQVELAKKELVQKGESFSDKVLWGIIIETPAAALISSELAKHVDFFSIGTNDLTQYIYAVDSTNPRVAHYYQSSAPAVMHTVDQITKNAKAENIPVYICGESASNPNSALKYASMGVDGLSMATRAINPIKDLLMDTDLTDLDSEKSFLIV